MTPSKGLVLAWRVEIISSDDERTQAAFSELSVTDFESASRFAQSVSDFDIPAKDRETLYTMIPTWLAPSDVEFLQASVRAVEASESVRIGSRVTLETLESSSPSSAIHLTIADGVYDEAAIWIDDKSFIARKPEESERLVVTYEPSGLDRERTRSLVNRYSTLPDHETSLEWFATIGPNSVKGSGNDRFPTIRRDDSSPELTSITLTLGHGVGWVIGRIVHRMGSSHRRDRDPTWQHRWLHAENTLPELAMAIPAISKDGPSLQVPGRAKRITVLIHGTVSTGMRIAASLFPSPPKTVDAAIIRYEHGTFAGVAESAADLATLISGPPLGWLLPQLIFVSHSRGGLVAIEAAKMLVAPNGPYNGQEERVWVHTFGTPHGGTPVASAGVGVASGLKFLTGIASTMAFSVLGADKLGWLFRVGLRVGRRLQGIADMDPNGSYVLSHLNERFAFQVDSWGGIFRADSGATGFGAGLKRGWSDAVFMKEPNDLVVTTLSATSGNTRSHEIDRCAHSDYFEHGVIRPGLVDLILGVA
jgi:hypothetical protein